MAVVQPRLAACPSLTRTIGRSRTAAEIHAAALEALESALGVRRSSILAIDSDGVMRVDASRGLSEGFRQALEVQALWPLDGIDPQPIVVDDVAKAPSLAPHLATVRAEGVAAMAFVPLVGFERLIGELVLCFDEPHSPGEDELQLASLIASQVAFALERMRSSAEAIERSTVAAQQLAAIVESSGDAIISKSLDGTITSWNRAAEQMYGYTAAEAIGQSIRIIIPPHRLTEEDQVLARIRAGEQVEMETIRRHRDGTVFPISLMVSPVRDAAGRIVGASKIARDITARKRGEAERAELHRRLTMLVTASSSLLNALEPGPVVAATMSLAHQLLVADGYAIWATSSAEGGWHVVRSEGVSAAFVQWGTNDSRANFWLPETGEPLAITDVFSAPLLKWRQPAYREEGIASMLICPMRLAGGRSATIVFYYRTPRTFSNADVETGQTLANLAASAMTTAELYEELRNQRNAAEEARRRAAFLADETAILSRSLEYEEIVAAVARLAVPEIADWCAVDTTDDSGRLRRVAVAHVDPAKVALAREIGERYPPDPARSGGIYEVVRTGKPVLKPFIPPDLIEQYARDDEHRQMLRDLSLTSYMCVPLVSPTGTLGAMTFVYAESGRRYDERDLAFAQEVAARAALAIENAFAYRRVAEASRLKDEFLATLSHELRTPLNAILGYAQMLSMGALAGDRRTSALAVLTRNADALKQIIDDVLDVSRIISGKLRLNVQPLDLKPIVDDAVDTIQPAADAKGVVLKTTFAGEVPAVSGDPDRLQQVVWNLLSNAVKFTPRGGVVRLELGAVHSAVQLVVQDNGQGIDSAFLPHIFERFRQADSRFSREHGGLGLGLAIARELTELHGGTLTAASPGVGQGATFTITLPALAVRTTNRDRSADAAAEAAGARALSARLAGLRVLAVDNEPDALGLVRTALESAGAEVTTVGSAQDALAVLEGSAFDVLVADIGMPRMDGLELIRSIRRVLPAPANRIPAAALTAYARAEDRVTALASGFQMHLAKPVNPIDLVIAVAALAGRT